MDPVAAQVYDLQIEEKAGAKASLISFVLAEKALVTLKILNEQEQEIRMLLNEEMAAGKHAAEFRHGFLSEGRYCIRLIIQTPKLIDINSLNIAIISS